MSERQPVGKRVNVKAVLVLAGAAAAVGVTVHFVHAHQVRRNAQTLADEAAASERDGRAAEAADRLGQYLQLRPDDADARARLGLLQSREAKDYKQAQQAYL